MATISRNRIRLKLDTLKPLEATYDFVSGQNARLPRARAVQFEISLFSGETLLALTGITSVTMEVKALTTAGVIDTATANVMSKTVSAASFNSTLTSNEWTNDSGATPYHAAFQFSVAETTLTMTGVINNVVGFGWVITATTASGTLCVGTGILNCVDDGGSGAGVPVPPTPTYTYTDAQIEAMLAGKLSLGENPAGAAYMLVSPDGTVKFLFRVGNDGSLHPERIT